MHQISLNEMYSDYLSGNLLRQEFEGLIYNYLIYNQEKTCLSHWKRDDYEDFISWFYPRLKKAIDSYKDVGASFEAFTARFLLVASKEHRARITSNAIVEYSAWCAHAPDMYAHEEPPEYIHKNTENTITDLCIDSKGRKNTKRMLALILKCYHYVSDDLAEKLAPKLGIDVNELLNMLSRIRFIRQKKDDRIYNMKESINTQFIRCMVYERKLSYLRENMNAYSKLKCKLDKARSRLEKMRKRYLSIRTDATNQQVAYIIGSTKGTIDSNLHKLKNKWERMSLNSNLN